MISLSNAKIILENTGKFTDQELKSLIKDLYEDLSPRLAGIASDAGASRVLGDFFDVRDWTNPEDTRPDINDY